MLDLRQTAEYATFLKLEGWTVIRYNNINYFLKKLPILGYFLKIQRPKKIDRLFIDRLIAKYKPFQITVEPINTASVFEIAEGGYKISKSPYLPTKTRQIDLRKPIKTIRGSFQRNIKTGVKRGEAHEIKNYSSPEELKIFRESWIKSVKKNRYVPSLKTLINLKKSFPQNKSLFLASHNISGRIIGGVIFTISSHDGSNYIISYMYGFTSQEGRSSLSHASLLYQGILWGKKLGCKIFDFEGIYDERFPNKSWLGFTRFKKSFGGFEVSYPGCYTKFRFKFFK